MTDIVTLTLNPTVDRNARIDRVVAEHKLRCHDERLDPGGGGINVASAIKQLGGDALAIYTAGGIIGGLLERLLSDQGIRNRPITISNNTRENVIITETESDQQYRFGFPGPRMTDREQQTCLDAVSKLEPSPKYLVLSGSLPPGVPEDFFGRVIEAMPKETRIALDVSGNALKRGVEQSVFLLKPNQRELGTLVGREIESDQDARDAAHQLIDRGKVQAMMVSLGRAGVMLVTGDEQHRIHAPTVKIQSKIGAGDSTVAGAILALQRGESLLDAARFAVACGSAAVMTPGTQLCRREDAERLYEELKAAN
jgi:6-phosphofructokinase 2